MALEYIDLEISLSRYEFVLPIGRARLDDPPVAAAGQQPARPEPVVAPLPYTITAPMDACSPTLCSRKAATYGSSMIALALSRERRGVRCACACASPLTPASSIPCAGRPYVTPCALTTKTPGCSHKTMCTSRATLVAPTGSAYRWGRMATLRFWW